jgi:hypothetical protein
MPFGKHEDQSLPCIFETDRQYPVWCLHEPWFRTKYGKLFDIIVEMFHLPRNDSCQNNIYNSLPSSFVVVFFEKKQIDILQAALYFPIIRTISLIVSGGST